MSETQLPRSHNLSFVDLELTRFFVEGVISPHWVKLRDAIERIVRRVLQIPLGQLIIPYP